MCIVTMQMTPEVVTDTITADLSAQLAAEGFPAAAVGMAHALTSAAYHVAVAGGYMDQHAAVSSQTVCTMRRLFQVIRSGDTGRGLPQVINLVHVPHRIHFLQIIKRSLFR